MEAVPPLDLLGFAACLVLSAFFSGSETALTALGRARTAQLIDSGASGARALRMWLDKPAEVLTTILIYNNLANITAAALATRAAENILGADGGHDGAVGAIPVAVGVTTLLLLTFGEITPKTIARANAARVAIPIMRVLRPASVVAWPFTRAFVALAARVSRLVGGEDAQDWPLVREEDIEYLVEIGGEEGTIPEEQARMIQSVFDFDDTVVAQVMVPTDEVVALAVSTDRAKVLDLLVEAGHSRMPVYAGDLNNVIGLCYAKDLLRELRDRGGAADFDLRALARPAMFVPEDKPINDLLTQMQERRVHMSLVLDDRRHVVGIVTLEDIVEELIGEVHDEFDPAVPPGPKGAAVLRALARSGANKPTIISS